MALVARRVPWVLALAALGALSAALGFVPRAPRLARPTRRVGRVARPAARPARYLPSLESMAAAEAEDAVAVGASGVLPCFPLPLSRLALPGSKRALNVMEPRYQRLYQDLLRRGGRCLVVPRYVQAARSAGGARGGVRLAESAVVFRLTSLKDAPEGARFRYSCQHEVLPPVRITRVLNPEDFAKKKTYLRVEYQEIQDQDMQEDLSHEEDALREELLELASLSHAMPLRRFEYMSDSLGRCRLVDHGVPFTEGALNMASAKRESFWDLAQLWQNYVERRAVALRQQQDRDLQQLQQLLRNGGLSPKELRAAHAAHAAQLEDLTLKSAEEAQRLLECDSHGQRLHLLRSYLQKETRRLAALNAVAASIGAEAQA